MADETTSKVLSPPPRGGIPETLRRQVNPSNVPPIVKEYQRAQRALPGGITRVGAVKLLQMKLLLDLVGGACFTQILEKENIVAYFFNVLVR